MLHRLLHSLRSVRAAIDLASIMVGVIVIGIIGAIIAATVFQVIPWTQDEAAKQNVTSVKSAEAVVRVKEGRYLDWASLRGGGTVPVDSSYIEDSDTTTAATDKDGTCYVAFSASATGKKVYYNTSKNPTVREFHEVAAAALPDWCPLQDLSGNPLDVSDLLDTIDPTGAPAGGGGGGGGSPHTPEWAPAAEFLANGTYNPGDPGGTAILSAPASWPTYYDAGAGKSLPDLTKAPYTTSLAPIVAAATGYVPGDYVEFSGSQITNVRGWIADKEVALNQNGWYVGFSDSFFIYTDNRALTIDGQARNSLLRDFFNDGMISFKVNGGTPIFVKFHESNTSPGVLAGDDFLDEVSDVAADYDARTWPAIVEAWDNRLNEGYDGEYNMTGTFSLYDIGMAYNTGGVAQSAFASTPIVAALATGSSGDGVGVTNMSIKLADGRNLTPVGWIGGDDTGDQGFIWVNYVGPGNSRVNGLSLSSNVLFNFGTTDRAQIKAALEDAVISFTANGVPQKLKVNTDGYQSAIARLQVN